MEGKEMGGEFNENNLPTLISATKRVSWGFVLFFFFCCPGPGSWTLSGEVGLSKKQSRWQRVVAKARCFSCSGKVGLREGNTGAWRKRGCPLLRSRSLHVTRQKWAPWGLLWGSLRECSGTPCKGSLHLSCAVPLCYASFTTASLRKLSIKLAQNSWSRVRNWDLPVFMHIVLPQAKVWVSDSEALGLRLYVCIAEA